VFNRRSEVGLVGTTIDVEMGEWQNTESHISGRIDSYHEYLLKAWLLFGDDEFKDMWDESIACVNRYLADDRDMTLAIGMAALKCVVALGRGLCSARSMRSCRPPWH